MSRKELGRKGVRVSVPMAALAASLAVACGGDGAAEPDGESESDAITATAMNSAGAGFPSPTYETAPQQLAAAVVLGGDDPAYPALSATSADDNPKWMEQTIPLDTYISDITIAGTHDSGAIHNGASPADTANAQTMDIAAQLQAGVRFLDIRFKPELQLSEEFVLQVYHGTVRQGKSGEEVVSDIVKFLDANPGETVLMTVKNESLVNPNDDEFQTLMEELMLNHKSYFYDGTTVPLLRDARKKIVLLRRYSLPHTSLAGAPHGLDAGAVWKDNTANGNDLLYVSDFYRFTCSTNLLFPGFCASGEGRAQAADKWQKVLDGLTKAETLEGGLREPPAPRIGPPTLHVTFTSATMFPSLAGATSPIPAVGAIPNFSVPINRDLRDFASKRRARMGVVAVDRATPALIRALIGTNPRRPFETGPVSAEGSSFAILPTNRSVQFAPPASRPGTNLGGVAYGRPAISSNLYSQLSVFVMGADGKLWTRWQTHPLVDPLAFNPEWVPIGGSLAGGEMSSDPVALLNCQGRMEVFARGPSNAIWTTWQSAGSAWHSWASIGGVAWSRPVVSASGCDVTVSVIGTDGKKWSRTRHNGVFGGWTHAPGTL
jgi:1-phosphatidylinositol phosphodiesterase